MYAAEGSSEQFIALSGPALVPIRLLGQCIYIGHPTPNPRRHHLRNLALLQQHRASRRLGRRLHVVAARSDAEHRRGRPRLDGTPRRRAAAVRDIRSDERWIAPPVAGSYSEADGLC